jgi:hypothetical protein
VTFVDRHFHERLGDYAGHRQHLSTRDIVWVLERHAQGLSVQTISNMGRIPVPDVQAIIFSGAELPRVAAGADEVRKTVVKFRRSAPDMRGAVTLPMPPQRLTIYRFTASSIQAESFGALNVRMKLSMQVDGLTCRIGPEIVGASNQRDMICQQIAHRHGLTVADMRGPRRDHHAAHARHEVMWALMKTGRWSTTQIGRYLGDRDHTTVIHGIRRYEARLAKAKLSAAA